MEQLETFEAKLLYKVYMLYKNNIINSYQRGRIKDMIIQKDERVEQAMNEYLTDNNEWRLVERFQTCSNEECSPRSPFLSEDCFSNKSSSRFKGKRPAQMKLPLKNFMINLRKNTEVTSHISIPGFYTCTSRSSQRLSFNQPEALNVSEDHFNNRNRKPKNTLEAN